MTSAGINRVAASQEEVQQQLERILSSREFRLPERTRKFLEFVVTETLAGRRDYLKAFTIAQAVLAGTRTSMPSRIPAFVSKPAG